MASAILSRHLRILSHAYTIVVDDDSRWFIAHNFRLPPGYDRAETSVLVTLPHDYPISPPGIGDSRVYLPPDVLYRGMDLRDLHPSDAPAWGEWAWFCYQEIRWDPARDNLMTFLEMVRADLTNPPTIGSASTPAPPPLRVRRSLFRTMKEFLK